ncbi:MAG TPA: zinc ribbon domain-containing protein, partial [Acidimicrobiales bacterium]|nr:zinc ribbon domain-containing protein [Acidimicrobiales bacterium]
AVALGVPAATLVGAAAAGVSAGVGSALLVLAAGTLVGTIALLWASVRTLSGDAPLTRALEASVAGAPRVDALAEQKKRVLRALKDLEVEHALGKIDDADHGALVARYRAEAKDLMREMDLGVEPQREEAERVAREYLRKAGLGGADGAPEPRAAGVTPDRMACGACGASNEVDAAFCKQCGETMRGAAEASDEDD